MILIVHSQLMRKRKKRKNDGTECIYVESICFSFFFFRVRKIEIDSYLEKEHISFFFF